MSIDWDEKPEWADVWLESFGPYADSGWRKDSGAYWESESKHCLCKKLEVDGYCKIHYPPEAKPEWDWDKERWIRKAINCCDPDYGQIYDALASGELPIPEVQK